MFAVTRNAPEAPDTAIPLMPDLYAVVDREAIDHIIRTTPNEARYFLGMMVWKPGQLANQVSGSLWDVRPPERRHGLARRDHLSCGEFLRGTWINSISTAVAGIADGGGMEKGVGRGRLVAI